MGRETDRQTERQTDKWISGEKEEEKRRKWHRENISEQLL